MNTNILRRLAWIAGGAALLLALLTITRSPLVWRDEMPFAALSYSLLNGGSGTPTILAEDPRYPVSTFFYGPFYFWLGAASFKLLGFSLFSFRLLSWLGGLLLALGAASLVRVLGGSWSWAAACWCLVLLSPELGSTLTNGRMDTLAVAGILGGLALFLQGQKRDDRRLSALSAPVWAATVLTTPRSLQFFLCLALAAPFCWRGAGWRKFAARFGAVGAFVAIALGGWILSQGETPLSWLRYVLYIGAFARPYSIMGGFWRLRPTPLWALTPLVCVFLVTAWRFWGGVWQPKQRELVWVTAALGGQSLLIFLTMARPESYSIFWGLPLLVVALAFLASQAQPLNKRALCLAILLVAAVFGGLRMVKLAEIAATWASRNPQTVEDFARQHIPPGSRVIGPAEYYFYAVEKAGSTYRFHEPLRDAYFPFLETKLNPAFPAAQAQKFPAHYLWWPVGKPLPRSCSCTEADRIATYTPPAGNSRLNQLLRFGGGYPVAGLYHIKAPE